MIIEDSFEQRSEQWYQAKAGVPSASSFNKIITLAGRPSTQAQDYLYQVVGEKILGTIEQGYTSFAMQQGIDREDEARMLYELISGRKVKEVALVYKNEQKTVSCSPDGLISGKMAGLEIKCPMLKTHVHYMVNNDVLRTQYYIQVQGSMWVCDFPVWILMSYYPGLEPVILEIERDENFCDKLSDIMSGFLKNLNETYAKIAK